MVTVPFTPHDEQTALYKAILYFRTSWRRKHTLSALCDAIDRAEEVYTELRKCTPEPLSDLALVASNLQLLMSIARTTVAAVEEKTLAEIGHRMATEEQYVAPSTVLPASTILSCPQCEEGLYKVTTRASIDDIVLDAGTILQPLNTTIPKREAWRALACPRCDGRYYKDGKVHTVQRGWQ